MTEHIEDMMRYCTLFKELLNYHILFERFDYTVKTEATL